MEIIINKRNRYLEISCPILSYPILSCPILSYPILSCPILSYLILSYPVLSYPVLSICIVLLNIRTSELYNSILHPNITVNKIMYMGLHCITVQYVSRHPPIYPRHTNKWAQTRKESKDQMVTI